MQRRRKDLGGAQDGKTKLANCVFFVVLAMRRSQKRTNGYGGIWCKGQVSLPAPKLPLVHSHHVRSSICRAVLRSYQGRSSLGFPSHSVEQKPKGIRPFHRGNVWWHWPYIIQHCEKNTDADHNKSVQLPALWMPKINIKLLLASKKRQGLRWAKPTGGSTAGPLGITAVVSSYRRSGGKLSMGTLKQRQVVWMRMQCGNRSGSRLPLLAVVLMWPLICLKSPKQQRGGRILLCWHDKRGQS